MLFDGMSIRTIVIHYYDLPNDFSNDEIIRPSKLDCGSR